MNEINPPPDHQPNQQPGEPAADVPNMTEPGEMREPEGVTAPSDPLEPAAASTSGPRAGHGPEAGTAADGTLPPPPAASWAATPAGGAQAPRRLYRSRHDSRLGGVSGGVAEYFAIDPTIVRLATVLLALTGVGVLLYIAAWLIIPLRPEGFVEPTREYSAAGERTLTLAFGIAALALAFGITTGSWEVLALALIGGGIWLLSERTVSTPVTMFAGAGPASAAGAPATSAFEPAGFPPQSGAPTMMPYAPPPPTDFVTPTPRAPREPQRITRAVLSVLALLTGVAIAASTGNWWDVSATRFLGAGVVVIGVGILAGQFRGGARGLIPLGMLAALALFPVSAVDGLVGEGIGDATFRPATIAQLQTSYEHGIGQMTVDLTELDFDGQDATVDIDLGIGELIVIVSKDAGGQAVLQAKAGEVSHQLPDTNSFVFDEGVNIDSGTILLQGENGTLDLTIDVGFGTAELRTEPAQ